MKFSSRRVVCVLFLVACASEGEDLGPGGPWTPTVTTWSSHVQPFLYGWCGGCHAKPAAPGATGCVGIRCFIDDPCQLQEQGCCSAEDPYLSCDARRRQDGTTHGDFTVGECAVMRVEYAIQLAQSGALEHGGAGAPPARFLAEAGIDLLDQHELDYLRGWIYGGQPMNTQCQTDGTVR